MTIKKEIANFNKNVGLVDESRNIKLCRKCGKEEPYTDGVCKKCFDRMIEDSLP